MSESKSDDLGYITTLSDVMTFTYRLGSLSTNSVTSNRYFNGLCLGIQVLYHERCARKDTKDLDSYWPKKQRPHHLTLQTILSLNPWTTATKNKVLERKDSGDGGRGNKIIKAVFVDDLKMSFAQMRHGSPSCVCPRSEDLWLRLQSTSTRRKSITSRPSWPSPSLDTINPRLTKSPSDETKQRDKRSLKDLARCTEVDEGSNSAILAAGRIKSDIATLSAIKTLRLDFMKAFGMDSDEIGSTMLPNASNKGYTDLLIGRLIRHPCHFTQCPRNVSLERRSGDA